MQLRLNTYIPGNTAVHLCDARVKLVLLVVYSITLFIVGTWIGLFICSGLCLGLAFVAKVPPGRLFGLLIPLYVILLLTVLFNGFSFDVASPAAVYGLGNVSSGIFSDWEAVPLIGSFGLVPEGLVRGLYYALRIILLVMASLVVSFTTTSTELIDALYDFLKPLRAARVPTEDVAMMASIALRFIPLTAEEFSRVAAASQARAANFDEGGLIRRIRAWQPVLIPVFVGLFRRADNLALAMETRCYAMSPTRTRLAPKSLAPSSVLALCVGLALCILTAILL